MYQLILLIRQTKRWRAQMQKWSKIQAIFCGNSLSNITVVNVKAYSKKEFEAALLYFGQSALMGPIDKETEKGREVAVALANRSAVHFEMEQW